MRSDRAPIPRVLTADYFTACTGRPCQRSTLLLTCDASRYGAVQRSAGCGCQEVRLDHVGYLTLVVLAKGCASGAHPSSGAVTRSSVTTPRYSRTVRSIGEFAEALVQQHEAEVPMAVDDYRAGEFEVAAISIVEVADVTAADIDELETLAAGFNDVDRRAATAVITKRRYRPSA